MAVFMSTSIWGQMSGYKSGNLNLELKTVSFHDSTSRKLFEPHKFPDSPVSQIFGNIFFKNPGEFNNLEDFKNQVSTKTGPQTAKKQETCHHDVFVSDYSHLDVCCWLGTKPGSLKISQKAGGELQEMWI